MVDPDVAEGEQPFLDVHLRDGNVLTRRVLVAKGDYCNPLGMDEVRAKFRVVATPVLGKQNAERLEHLAMTAAELPDVNELVECLLVSPFDAGN